MESKYGEKVLAAAIILGKEADKDRELKLVKERCSQELPNYMVPRHIAVMEKFPRLSSGKTDRKTLSSMLAKDAIKPREEK